MSLKQHPVAIFFGTAEECSTVVTDLRTGTLWWATNTGTLSIWDGTEWVAQHHSASGIIVWRSDAHTVGDSAWAAMTFDRELTDTEDAFTAPASQVSPDVAGYYSVSASVIFSADGTGIRKIRLVKNGTQYLACQTQIPDGAEVAALTASCAMVYLDGDTDYVGAELYQTSGGNLDTVSAGDDSTLRDRYSLYLQLVGK